MPELPEVETVRRSIADRIQRKSIRDIDVYFAGGLEGETPESLRQKVRNRRIRECGRRAKYLILELSDGAYLVIHLRMTGKLKVVHGPVERTSHTRWVMRLERGWSLRFDDQRKFGRLMWLPDRDALDRRVAVGPDPLERSFDVNALAHLLEGRRRPIKSFLLDQRLIGGLGNIYADEALFRAGIAPDRPAGSLEAREVSCLHKSIRNVLEEGLEFRGTTLRDFVDGDGRKGAYQDRLKVYGREGEACPRCGRPIVRAKLGGRSSFHCPRCQS